MSEGKQISVRRERGFYAIFRRLNIHVDGTKVLEIKAGETLPIDLPATAQQLHMQMDWVHSDPLDLSEIRDGDTLVIHVAKRSFRQMTSLNTMPFVISVER